MTQIKVLDQGFIELIDSMGDDHFICRAARTSYGKDSNRLKEIEYEQKQVALQYGTDILMAPGPIWYELEEERTKLVKADETLIRRLMRDRHTSPFEMVEFVFCVQVPMDCWRQWIRHRTANVNEYSTRYSEALDFFQQTDEAGWRLQATDNKQGSSGFVEEWPEDFDFEEYNDQPYSDPGLYLSTLEKVFHDDARYLYKERLRFGVAREQARKDLPLSTYTRAYWKCDLHNIFNFLELRMDKHAQLEIRTYANAMAELVKQVCPMAFQAFMDYRVNAMKLSAQEIAIIAELMDYGTFDQGVVEKYLPNKTEREQCLTKLKKLKIL